MSETPLRDREILVVVTGGIAAFKSATFVRELQRLGARCEVVLTEAAQRFIAPLTFAGITSRPARTALWDPNFAGELHIELTRRAEAVCVVPATADFMAKVAQGHADDLASTCLLSTDRPVFMAPAMHPRMWNHPATQANASVLRARGVTLLGPTVGPLASGESGVGRMLEPEALAELVSRALAPTRDLAGVRVLVSAGPTHEPIDPVRFVGNRSSGRMGFALAERAKARGATVTIVAGPVSLQDPPGVEVVRVQRAVEMRDAIVPRAKDHDVVIMAAAVADYRPATVAEAKIKKSDASLSITLVKNPDILNELGHARADARRPVLVGFAVETGDLVGYARDKLARKRCDMIVANLAEHGFEGTDNVVTLVRASGEQSLGRRSKHDVADAILDAVTVLLHQSS